MLRDAAAWLALVALAALCVYSAFGLARRLYPRVPFPFRATAACVIGSGLLTGLFHLMLWTGTFRLGVALPLLGGVAGALSLSGRTWRDFRAALARDVRWLLLNLRACSRRPTGWAALFLAAAAWLALARCLLVPALAWDTLTYHGPKAALWVQGGAPDRLDAPGGWGQYYRLLPGGGEALFAWAALPLRSDLALGLVSWCAWLAVGLVLLALGRHLGLRARDRWAGAAYVTSLPALWLSVGTGYTEPLLLLDILAGTVLALDFLKTGRGRSAALSLVALGLAAGCKHNALPVFGAGAAVVLAAAVGPSLRRRRHAIAGALLGLALGLAACAPWWISNALSRGRPFDPLPVEIAGWELGRATSTIAWYEHRPEIEGSGLTAELHALSQMFRSPLEGGPHLGWISLVVLALGLDGWRRRARAEPWGMVFVAALAFAVLAFFYQPAFRVIRLLWAPHTGRFLLPLVAVATMLGLPRRVEPAARWRRVLLPALLWSGALVHVARNLFQGWAPFEVWAVPALAAWLAVLVWAVAKLLGLGSLVGVATAVLLVAGTGLSVGRARDAFRCEAAAASEYIHPTPRHWAPAAAAVDTPGVPRRIAVTSGPAHNADNWFLLFFLGRRFQNRLEYVPSSADGQIHDFGLDTDLATLADRAAWLRRLRERGVTEVMTFPPASLELGWMSADGAHFQMITGDGRSWGLYRIRF